ncbi:MAG: hypothetical protein J6V53_03215 [Alphaproteobacteria bacterium]|nr:hypothetical protein [Alphaproteobacteria bacterium]
MNYSKQASFLMLSKIQEMALDQTPKPDFTAALRAEELKGKLFHLYQEKKEPDKSVLGVLTPKALVSFIETPVKDECIE